MTVDRGLQNVRLRVEPDRKARWEAMFTAHKISQQEAIVTAIDMMEGFDPMLRAMLFGQVPDAYQADVAKLILNRIAGAGDGLPTPGRKGKPKK